MPVFVLLSTMSIIENDSTAIDSKISTVERPPLSPKNCDRIVKSCSSLNLCQSHPNLHQNLRRHQTAKQFFVNIVKELRVMELSARVYVLQIVTTKSLSLMPNLSPESNENPKSE
jgi:hypothetical protein